MGGGAHRIQPTQAWNTEDRPRYFAPRLAPVPKPPENPTFEIPYVVLSTSMGAAHCGLFRCAFSSARNGRNRPRLCAADTGPRGGALPGMLLAQVCGRQFDKEKW